MNVSHNNIEQIDSRIMTLLEVTKAMTSTLDIEELLQRIVKAVTEVLPCEYCILWMFDEKKGKLTPEKIQGFSWGEVGNHSFAPGEGTIGTAFSTQEKVITNNLRQYTKFVRKGDIVDHIVSLLDVPLILDGKSIGVLDAANKIPGNDFNDEDAKLLFILGAQAAVAINNARTHTSIQRQAHELNVLHSITRTIGTNLNTLKVLDIILDETSHLMQSHDCSIFLFNSNTNELHLAAAKGSREDLVGKLSIPSDQGLLGYVASSRKTLMVSGGDLDEYRDFPPEDYGEFKTAVASALSLPNKLLGVIEIRDTVNRKYNSDSLRLFKTITRQMAVFLEKAELYQTVQEIYLEVIKSLSEAVEAKDPETIGHCFRVSDYAARIAGVMQLDEDIIEQIRFAAHLHDIGKIGVPEAILLKPARLTDDEYEIIKTHCAIGAKILTPIELFGKICDLVEHHHEHFDGSGYPDGLVGDGIPLGSRIISVADSFEAMTWNRPYQNMRSPREALMEIKRCTGSQFDPDVVDAFQQVYQELFS